ncbi:MAG: DUF3306 domain-containing protein [Gammaproteobacteria bacterium]
MTKADQENREADHAKAGFVGRWSRRKRDARAAERKADNAAQPSSADRDRAPGMADPPAIEASDRPADDQPTDADLPPLDSLGADSDYSGFLSPRVGAQLKRLALRKLFHSSKFNVRDPLDSEAGDFTRFEPLGDAVTADMRHQLARAQEALKDKVRKETARPGSVDSSAAAPTKSGAAMPAVPAAEAVDVAPDAQSDQKAKPGAGESS